MRSLPPHMLLGLALIAVAWPTAWSGLEPFSNHAFFPLWLGYILTVDSIVLLRAGTSLLARSRRRFVELFLLSVPVWWLFEVANDWLGNWEYVYSTDRGFLSLQIFSSIAFSTVIPAIFETAELYRTTRLGGWGTDWWRFAPGGRWLPRIAAAGALLFIGSLAFPDVLFPAVWLGLFFFLDPVNRMLGRPSLAGQVAHGRWDTVLALFAAGITCGFFWEMWNFWSMPKWVYHVPFASGLKVFEMPLLGYGGYLPFALEIYAIYHFGLALLRTRRDDFLRFDKLPGDLARSRSH